MLHCYQFVDCKYSIVGCISVYSNEVFFSNVKKMCYCTFSWHNFTVGWPFDVDFYNNFSETVKTMSFDF